ncbi:MAG TPA: DUF885 domain-containing protein [Jatrophihabitans sp.]|nr:DUF885 domain-containing protein [Jatrophihabitans sp.]
MTSSATPPGRLPAICAEALTGRLERSPVDATYLGDHGRDGRLDDPSESAARRRAAELRTLLAELGTLEPDDPDDRVDAAMLRTVLAAELLELDELGEAEWNPMEHNPGSGLHALLSRDFAPLGERLDAVVQRLAAVPDYLAAARERLSTMSSIHLQTALGRLDGTIALIDTGVAAALDEVPAQRDTVTPAAAGARQALVEHREWLAAQAGTATRDPRIGPDLFRAKLALTLDTAFDPPTLLARAEAHLARMRHEIVEHAGRYAGVAEPDDDTVRRVLDELAADAPTDRTILGLCRDALRDTTSFVRDHDLVTVHDDPIAIVDMPEIDRGVAVAYCRPNGPLEATSLPTEFAVSPTPADWSAAQVASFYREYNAHMLQNLTVHEAMPGHALQLMHANRYRGRTPVRAVWWSGTFVEGWAVYSEELMAERGYRTEVSPRAAAAVRMQQLKMQLRTTINAILDIRYHCDDLDEAGAMSLMMRQGFQEQGEAAGKWRRVQLSSTQLCTYFVGWTEVRTLADDLRRAHPGWSERRRHDTMLAHGSPPVRHIRRLLGLHPADG